MHYLKKRRRNTRKKTMRDVLFTLAGWLVNLALLALISGIFAFTIINWLTGCCERGGSCVPDWLYPQCEAVHKEAPYNDRY